MSYEYRPVTGSQRLFGRLALLIVVLALIGNVAAFALLRPYGILLDMSEVAEAREQIHTHFVAEIDDQALLDAAIKGMADSLGDRNTRYFDAKELAAFKESVSGQFSGIGAEIDIHENRLRIIAPIDGSPAWESGVLPGDIVLEIEGKDTEGIDIYDAMDQLKGVAGTDVTIKVRHRDGTLSTLTITRGTIQVDSVRGYRRDPGNGYHYMIDPQRKIAYVRLTQFGDKSASEFEERMRTLKKQGMKALILDLRDNGGGLLDAAVSISDLFLTQDKTIVSTQGRSVPGITATSTASTLLPDTPLVVLVNGDSASASEILAGAVLDNDRGLLVGTRTFGKGSVQQLHYLGDKTTAVKLTTAHWYLPSGRMIHREDDAEQWGVDPSPGCFVPMDSEQRMQMLLKQREDEAQSPYEKRQGPITPQWVRDEILDDQLAAALDAAQSAVDKGAWPKGGVGLEQNAAQPTERDRLLEQRKELKSLLEQIDAEIETLEQDDHNEPATSPPTP